MINTGSNSYLDTKEAILSYGHEVVEFFHHFYDFFIDEYFAEQIKEVINNNRFDSIFTIGFFPLIACTAHEFGLPYISWCLESTLNSSFSYYFGFDTSQIYIFDRSEVEKYNKAGFNNVFHLPPAVNSNRIATLSFPDTINRKFASDISFVGSLYESTLDALMYYANDYVKGYVEGLFQSQFKIYGCNFLENAIPDSVLQSLNDSFKKIENTNIIIDKKGLANAIYTKISNVERTVLMELLAETNDLRFYSNHKYVLSNKIKQPGPFADKNERIAVYKNSKLNLFSKLFTLSL